MFQRRLQVCESLWRPFQPQSNSAFARQRHYLCSEGIGPLLAALEAWRHRISGANLALKTVPLFYFTFIILNARQPCVEWVFDYFIYEITPSRVEYPELPYGGHFCRCDVFVAVFRTVG